jgi:cell wall-associated NlpC family hydrolase
MRENGFLHVEGDDKYQGWIDESYCEETKDSVSGKLVVISDFAILNSRATGLQMRLPFGAYLGQESESGSPCHPVSGDLLEQVSGELVDAGQPVASSLVEVARRLLGVPYLWGGTSTFGYDCSGLTQAVFRSKCLVLPRDSKDQVQIGTEITNRDMQSGDLLFWPGHVAIYAGEQKIIHATRKRGIVAEESLDPDAPEFRDDLADSISSIRRIKVTP